jgi:hypothetical protein
MASASSPIPNLFIIGSAKCGTSSLHAYLAEHPQIFMSYLKEPAYFTSPDDGESSLRKFVEPGSVHIRSYRNDLESYLQLFANAGDAAIIGESSGEYTTIPARVGVAKRIHDFNPRARLIYIMRDPVERTISHYWWRVQHDAEHRDIMSAIREDSYYRDVSNYALQLEPYLDLFGKENLLCLTLEELKGQPDQELGRLFAWLGVDSSFMPRSAEKRENVTPDTIIQQKKNLFSTFRKSRLWNAITPFTPRALRCLGRWLAQRRVSKKAVDVSAVIDFLRPIQLPQSAALCRLLQRDFPEWKTLYGNAQQTPVLTR